MSTRLEPRSGRPDKRGVNYEICLVVDTTVGTDETPLKGTLPSSHTIYGGINRGYRVGVNLFGPVFDAILHDHDVFTSELG